MFSAVSEAERDAITMIVFVATFFVALGIGRFLKHRAGVRLGLLFRLFCLILAFYAAIAVYGVHAPRRTGDMGIDGYSFFERLPIQVKQVDSVGRKVVDEFEKAMTQAGNKPEIYRYDAAHAFANEKSPAYDAACAAKAWERMMAFLGANL